MPTVREATFELFREQGDDNRVRVALQHPRLRNQLRLSRPGSYHFSAVGVPPASVGVQLAQPDRPVVCVLGEDSAQYGITAVWSAVAYDAPVTFLVLWRPGCRPSRSRRPRRSRRGGELD